MRKIATLLAFLLTALPALAQSPQLSQGQVLGNFAAGLRPAKATSLLTFPVASGNSACFSGTTGLLQDCGLTPSLFVPRDVRWPIGGSPGAACDWNGTTGTDDTAAIQLALNTYKSVLIPKNCAIAGTLTFGNLAFATITGINGPISSTNLNTGSSVLVATNANLPLISVVSTIPGLAIQNLGLTRSVAATAGGNGIQFNGYNDNPILDNIQVQKQYIGVDLTGTGYGIFQNSYVTDSISDNILCDGPRMTIAIQCQWYLTSVLSQRAGRGGTGWNYNVQTPPTGAIDNKMTMGTWVESKSFAGATGGANFKGNINVRLQGVRIIGGFYGESGGAELNFDTFNSTPGPHQISNVFAEINTNGACLNFTGNNATINMSGATIIGCNTAGIVNNATLLNISGTQILNNATFGIVNGGTAQVTGSNLSNNISGPFSNSGTYVGRSNTPATANTAIATTELSGTLQAAQEPAHTGDVTNSAGSLGLSLVAGNAGSLNSGTLLAARMPALTGDCTTSAGAVATACTKINGVDQTVAWTTYTPTVTGSGGSCGACSITATGRSRQIGKTYIAEMDITIAAIGSWTAGLNATLPTSSAAFRYAGTCFEYALTGKSGAAYVNGPAAPTIIQSRDAAAGSWWVNGYALACTIVYEAP